MADRAFCDLKGLEAIQRKLEQKGRNVIRTLRVAGDAAAEIFEQEAKDLVHVDEGDVRDSIGRKVVVARKGYVKIRVGPGRGGMHGIPLEVGHIQSGKFAGVRGHVPAYPFMRPAYESRRDEANRAAQDALVRAAMQ